MKTLPFSLLNSSELYAIASRIVEACKQTNGKDEYLMKLCSYILEANVDLRKGLGRTFNNEFTSVLLVADEKRDGAFLGLRDYIHACCNSGEDAKEEAAKKLSDLLSAVGNTINRMAYAAETTKMDVLFERLNSAVAQESLGIIKANDWLERLKARQADFENVYQSKLESDTGIDFPLLKKSRQSITINLKGLLIHIETGCLYDSAQFAAIEEKINEIITDAVTIVRSRGTRKENAEKKEDKSSS